MPWRRRAGKSGNAPFRNSSDSLYLRDPKVVSELRRPNSSPAVLEWSQEVAAEHLYLSAVTIGEIQAGIEITRQQNEAKAEELEAWLEQVLATHNILAVDATASSEWAKLMHRQSWMFPQEKSRDRP